MSWLFDSDINDKDDTKSDKDGWGRNDPPKYGTIDDHDVLFKTNDQTGETLLADATEDNYNNFNDHINEETGQKEHGHHDHYGPGGWSNDNGTDRGYYTGPGPKVYKD